MTGLVLGVVGVVCLLIAAALLAMLPASRLAPARMERRVARSADESGVSPVLAQQLMTASQRHMQPVIDEMQRLTRPMRIGTIALASVFAAGGVAALAAARSRSDIATGAVLVAVCEGVVAVACFRRYARQVRAFAASHGATVTRGNGEAPHEFRPLIPYDE